MTIVCFCLELPRPLIQATNIYFLNAPNLVEKYIKSEIQKGKTGNRNLSQISFLN